MEKQKKEAYRSSNRQLWGCLGFVFFVCFGLLGLSVMIPKFFYGRIPQTSLAPELIPTAEALLSVPLTVLVPDDGVLFLEVLEKYYGDTDSICIRGWYDSESKFYALLDNSSLFIDETWIIGASRTSVGFGKEFGGEVLELVWCATGELQPGIHLIEFQLKDSFWGEPMHIQQWAIEID
jgi:hypothetical protein